MVPCFPALGKVYVSRETNDNGIYLVYRIHFTLQNNINHETIPNRFYPEQETKNSFFFTSSLPGTRSNSRDHNTGGSEEKIHRVFQKRSRTYDVLVTSPDALPQSNRTLVGAIAEFCLISIGSSLSEEDNNMKFLNIERP